MSAEVDLLGFSEGEDVIIELFAKDDQGAALTDDANEVISINFARTKDGASVFRREGLPEIVATAPLQGNWTITLDAADVAAAFSEGRSHYYEIWSSNGSTGKVYLQAEGRFVYKRSIGPT